MTENKRLYRSESDRILGGVCGGIAETYNLDPTLVRLATVVLAFTGAAEIVYLIAWLIMPTESEVKNQEDKSVEETEEE